MSLKKRAAAPGQGSIDFDPRTDIRQQGPLQGNVVSFEDGKRSNEKHGERAAEKLLLEKAAKLRW